MKNLCINNFFNAGVAVIGDLMIDHYLTGDSNRVSPEAPIPVLCVEDENYLPGGAGNVATNLAALGSRVWLMGVYGDDIPGKKLAQHLRSQGVTLVSEPHHQAKTLVKQRLIARGQQMLRVDFESKLPDITDSCLQSLTQLVDKVQIVILSDYAKGVLCRIEELISCARKLGMLVLVDPKGDDFSRYKGASIITPNWSEFAHARFSTTTDILNPRYPLDYENATQAQIGQTQAKAQYLIDKLNLDALIITRSEHGMSVYQNNKQTLHIAAFTREVFDVTGAGDTVIATLGAAIGSGHSVEDATLLANYAASIVVGKTGVASTSQAELAKKIAEHTKDHDNLIHQSYTKRTQHLPLTQKIIGSDRELKTLIEQCKTNGDRIVLTNGCFDILHPGHVHYLNQSRALGDRLVVLVNSDASVTKLKGENRPIHSLADRLYMLAGLSCVDWVYAFMHETPQEIIAMLLPDCLVKGGDYTDINTIAGASAVVAAGGEVKLIPFVKGYSTTTIINTIQNR